MTRKKALDLLKDLEGTALEAFFFETEKVALGIPATDKNLIQRAYNDLRLAFDDLAKLTEHDQGGYEAITRLMSAASTIGRSAAFSEMARTHALKAQAAIAQTGKNERAAARAAERKSAILQAAGKTELVGSVVFAESIRGEVCEILGVSLNDRGYSSRSLLRDICAILQERIKT